MRQVTKNKGSALFQRSFIELARHYGWPDELIVVNDRDLGFSGRDIAGREGYKSLRQQIFEGRVGAVFCAEESRLDRDFSAFAQLINLCAACNTLIIDERGVYDPNNDNDWTFLGHTGVSNEAERRRIVQRSIAVKRAMAETRELRLMPPTGYVYDDDGKLIIDPDENEEVQATIRLFFDLFNKYGSAMQVVKHFNRGGIKFPTRKKGSGKNRPVTWGKISIGRALHVLRNPAYAGAYAYGRKKTIREPLSAETAGQKKRKISVGLDADEMVLVHEAHEGYITWEKFTENQQRIKNNLYRFAAGSSGAARNGAALLQGIIRCGQCGRAMCTFYMCRKGRAMSGYKCEGQVTHFGTYCCVSISNRLLDEAVTDALMEALGPARVRMTLQALEQAGVDAKADDRQQVEVIKRAHAEVDEARRRFESIDPQYDLVAKKYQKILQEKMTVAEQLEAKRSKSLKASSRQLPDEVRRSLLELSHDVRKAWESATMTNVERKMVLRRLITKVTIKRREKTKYLDIEIHWAAGAITPLVIVGGSSHHPEAVELIRQLAPDHTVVQITDRLNQAGYKPVQGERYTRFMVYSYTNRHGIKLGCPQLTRGGDEPRGDGRYSSRATARMLNIGHGTVMRWCKSGILDAVRSTPKSPHWIKLSPDQISKLKKKKKRRQVT